jgi:hypothetical protein
MASPLAQPLHPASPCALQSPLRLAHSRFHLRHLRRQNPLNLLRPRFPRRHLSRYRRRFRHPHSHHFRQMLPQPSLSPGRW